MNDMKITKIAMVGTGIIAGDHLGAIAKNDETELVAVADVNEASAKKVGEKYSVPYYTDYKEMAENEEFDVVILNLPHFLHCDVSVYFLERDIHVLCEKPMANTVEECDRMLKAESKSKARLAIAHPTRHKSGIKCIKKFVDDKTLGELCMITESRNGMYFTETRPKWFLDKKLSGGGVFMNFGAHSLDTLMYITGGIPGDVNADIGNILNDCDVEGHAQVKLKIDGKIPCSITFSGYISPGVSEVVFYFSKGTIKLYNNGYTIDICGTSDGSFKPYEFEEINAFETQLAEFLNFIKGEQCNIADGITARKIIEIINEVYSQNN